MPRISNKRKNCKKIKTLFNNNKIPNAISDCGRVMNQFGEKSYGIWSEEKQEWQFNGVSTSKLMLLSMTNKLYEEAIENNFDSLDELVVTNTFGDLFPPREVEHDHITRVLPKHEQMRLKEFYSLPENKKKMDDFFAK